MPIETFDTIFSIHFNKDYSKCELIITDFFSDISFEQLLEYLNSKGIVHGIKSTILKAILNGKFNLHVKILIAETEKTIPGKDGSIIYLKSEEIKIKKNALGVADFYNTGIIKTVAKGEELIRIIAPTKGTNSTNILGKEIIATPGKTFEYSTVIGPGTELSKDKKYVIAAIDGCYKRKGGVVSVIEKLDVKQNLNFSIGNFNTTTTVEITGDIKYGFNIKASSDLLVHGVIEDAAIDIGENIICKAGITKGVRPLKAGKSIRTKYINNKKNITAQDIFVEGTIFTSEIKVINSVYSNSISGGITTAGIEVDVDILGNKHNIRTVINIGLTEEDIKEMFTLKNEIYNMKELLSSKENNLFKKQQITKDAIKAKSKKLQNITNKSLLQKFEKEKELKLKVIEDFRTEILRMKNVLSKRETRLSWLIDMKENPKSRVVVREDVHPGTIVNFNTEQSYTVKTTMSRVVFKLNSEGELKPFNITEVDDIK